MNPDQSAETGRMDEKLCVRCGVPFEYGQVPCPDAAEKAKRGLACLVMHYGDRCPQCGGRVFENEQIVGSSRTSRSTGT